MTRMDDASDDESDDNNDTDKDSVDCGNSGAPQLSKSILENLVITCPYTARWADRLSAPQAHQCKITQSTGMSTQMQLKKNRMTARTFKERKNQQSLVFFDVIFDVYTHVDNREKRRILQEEKHENSKRL